MEGPLSVNPWVAFGILAGSGALAVLAADARLALAAIAGQYIGAGLLLAYMGAQPLAWLHMVVGGLACLILYLGLRGQPKTRPREEPPVPLPFRIMALMLTLLAGGLLHARWPLPYAGGLTSLACFGLAGLFVAQAGLYREPIRAGLGALTLLTAVSLYLYGAGGGLLLTAWALASHLMVSLAVGHLQSTWSAAAEEEA